MSKLRMASICMVMGIAIILDAISVSEDGFMIAILYLLWDIPALVGYFEKNKEGFYSLSIFQQKSGPSITIALLSAVFLGVAHHIILLESGKGLHGWFGIKIQNGLGESLVVGAIAILLPVIYEEVSRYGVYLFVKRRLGEKIAFIISAALFSIMHIKSFSDGPQIYSLTSFAMISLFIRFVSGLVYLNLSRNNGLGYAVISHFIVNSVIIIPVYVFGDEKGQIYFNITMAALFSAVALFIAFYGKNFPSGMRKVKQNAHSHPTS